MSSIVKVNTYAHSVTHVTDNILSGLKRIILLSGLSLDKLTQDWKVLEAGISKWLTTKHLETVTLEVYTGSSTLVGRWDFDISYTYTTGDDGDLWADVDAIKMAIKKVGALPSSCSYRVIANNKKGRPDVAGWSATEYLSTDGFTKRPIGTTIGATHLGAGTSYWSK